MPIYNDEVGSSVQKVRAVLSERGMLDGFTSSLKDNKTAKVSEEIVNFISNQLEQYLASNTSETIDQVSGRIQSKLDDLNESGISITDTAIEKIKQVLSDNNADETSDHSFDDISEKVVQILNGVGSKISKFKDFLTGGKEKEDKKDKKKSKYKLPDQKKFIKFIDDVMPNVVFFEDKLDKLQEYLITKSGELQNMGFEVAVSTIALATANMALAASNAMLAASNFQLAISNMQMAFANIQLSIANFALAGAKLLLSASNIALMTARVSLLVSVTSFMTGILTSVMTSTSTFISVIISSISTGITSLISLALTFSSSILSLITTVFNMSATVISAIFSTTASVVTTLFSSVFSIILSITGLIVSIFTGTLSIVTSMVSVVFSLFAATLSIAISLVITALSIAMSLLTTSINIILSAAILAISMAFTVMSISIMVATFIIGMLITSLIAVSAIAISIVTSAALLVAGVLASSILIGFGATVLALSILAGALVITASALAIIAATGAFIIAASIVAAAIVLAFISIATAIILGVAAIGASIIITAGLIFAAVLTITLSLIMAAIAVVAAFITAAITAFSISLGLLLILIMVIPLAIVWGIRWLMEKIKDSLQVVDNTIQKISRWLDNFGKSEDGQQKNTNIFTWISGIAVKVFDIIEKWVKNWSVWNWLIDAYDFIKNMATKVKDSINDVISFIKDKFIDWWNSNIDGLINAGKIHLDLKVKEFDLDLFSWLGGIKIAKENIVSADVSGDNQVKDNVVIADQSPNDVADMMRKRSDDVSDKVQSYTEERRRKQIKNDIDSEKEADAVCNNIISEINKDTDDIDNTIQTPVVPVRMPGMNKSLEEQEG